MKINNVLVVFTNPTTEEYKSTLTIVKKILKKYGINFISANRDRLDKKIFKDQDLIIAVGGDGTFLRAAQFIKNQILFGVNADVKNKEGFFMMSNKNDFERKLGKIINGRFKIKKLPRLEARINNKKIEMLALNEFFIGPRKSYHAAKYLLMIDGKKERQKSSGILATTPTGSYAWAKSCCNKTLPLNSRSYQYVVREPYEGEVFRNYKLKYGVIAHNQKITVVSEMLNGILVADSVSKEYVLKNGSTVVIRLSDNYLSAIWFK